MTTYTVFDLETTGLTPAADRILQIAAMRVRGGRAIPEDCFHTFVHPGCTGIPPVITRLTGITWNDVARAPYVTQALRAFSAFVGDTVLVAHQAYFDASFVKHAGKRMGMAMRGGVVVDSKDLSKARWPEANHHTLDAVVERLGIENGSGFHRHDARADVWMTAKAVEILWHDLAIDSATLPAKHLPCTIPVAETFPNDQQEWIRPRLSGAPME